MPRTVSLQPILIFAAGLCVLQPAYLIAEHLHGRGPLLFMEYLFQFSLAIVILQWIVADAHERRQTPCFDYGFFLLLLWPISLFWYGVRTRGWRGLALALGLCLLTVVPSIATALVGIVSAVIAGVLRG